MNELIILIKLNLIRRQLYIKFIVEIKTSSYNNFDILQNILYEEEPKWVVFIKLGYYYHTWTNSLTPQGFGSRGSR